MIPSPGKQHAKHTGWMNWAAGEGHLISPGWLHRQAFLSVPKLHCGGGHGEKQGVWRGQIRSRHVPWHDSELPVGMTLFFFILLNIFIFCIFWPGLCQLLLLLQSSMQNTICLPTHRFAFFFFNVKKITCFKQWARPFACVNLQRSLVWMGLSCCVWTEHGAWVPFARDLPSTMSLACNGKTSSRCFHRQKLLGLRLFTVCRFFCSR